MIDQYNDTATAVDRRAECRDDLLTTTKVKHRGWSASMVRKLLVPVCTGTTRDGNDYSVHALTAVMAAEQTDEYDRLRKQADSIRNRQPKIPRVQAAVDGHWMAGVACVPLEPLSKGSVRADARPLLDTLWDVGPTWDQCEQWFAEPANVGILCGIGG